MVDDDDDLGSTEPGAATVEQRQQGVGSQEGLFLQQIAWTALGLGVVEHGLDLGVETVLQPDHRFGVPGC